MTRKLVLGLTLLAAAGLAAAPAALPGGTAVQEPADLVLWHGKVATVDEAFSMAQAIAVRGHEIVAVGSDAEIEPFIGTGTEVIDLAGRLAVPGFIEGHGHFLGLGRAKMILDLMSVSSWQEIVDMVAQAAEAAEPGEWIYGRGWHQEKWTSTPEPSVDGVPLHASLSAVSPDNPVVLTHASGHASFANGRALELAGIDASTPDPAGGKIVRTPDGEATGLLRETASRLIGRASSAAGAERTDEERDAEFRRQVELAAEDSLSKGVTSFQDAGSGFGTIDRLRAMADAGELPIRLYVMVRGQSNEQMDARLPEYRILPEGDAYLAVRSIKHSIDGALGSHGAWLLEPYDDKRDSTGHETTPVETIERTAEIALKHGFQLNTHAIGDRANREVLDLYQRTFEAAEVDGAERRWRVEHAQHLHPDDIPRFGQLGVIASMQGVHCTSDGTWIPARLGEERSEYGAYVWRDLLESGAVVTNGTDAPVEDVDPIASYYASVGRVLGDGSVFYEGQRMSREEALRSYTIWAAYSAFEEDIKGSLEVGKLADITVLSQDLLTVEISAIPSTEVEMTIVGGRVRYQRPAADEAR